MRILAIVSPRSGGTCLLKSLEIAVYWTQSGWVEALIQGTVGNSSQSGGELFLYLLGSVDLAAAVSDDASETRNLELELCEKYSVVCVPYAPKSSDDWHPEFAVRLANGKESSQAADFKTSIYVGSPDVSHDLEQRSVWRDLVPIERLRLWLFYPDTLRLVSSRPRARPGLLNTARRLGRLFSPGSGVAGSSLVYWEHSLVSKINPFVASATFTTLDSVQRQVEEQAQAVHEIAAVVARLQAGLRELEMTMDQLSQHMSFRSRLLSWVVWAILGLLMVVVFLVVYHVLRG